LYDGDVFGEIEGQLVIWCKEERQVLEDGNEETATTSKLYAVENEIPYVDINVSHKTWSLREGDVHDYTGETFLGELPVVWDRIDGEMVDVTERIAHVYYSEKEINKDNNSKLISFYFPHRILPSVFIHPKIYTISLTAV
jgi:hypothetical protein